MGHLLSNDQSFPTQFAHRVQWSWLRGLCLIGLSLRLAGLDGGIYPTTAYAQTLPDRTLGTHNSSVSNGTTSTGFPAQLVNGGIRRDANLFHSFSELNIAETDALYFLNPENVNYIFTRVTGGNESIISGLLGVDGPADFYLMNPAGVVFSEHASLDVQGAFFATTGESISFADGSRFNAAGNIDSTLLTVSVPLGLQYQPRPIQNHATLESRAINLITPQSLNFVADRILITGRLQADGGIRIQAGTIELFNEAVLITKTQGSENAGDISLVAHTGDLSLRNSVMFSSEARGSGSGGDMLLTALTGDIILNDDVELISETRGSGTGGNILLTAPTGHISLTSALKNIELRSGSRGRRTTGDAGTIHIQGATIRLEETEVRAESEGRGQAGNIHIEALNGLLTLEDDVLIRSDTRGQGDSGDVTLIARNDSIHLRDDVEIYSETRGGGDGGDITLIAQDDEIRFRNHVKIRSGVRDNGTGDAGDIHLQGSRIFLDGKDARNNVVIQSAAMGRSGDAGHVLIEALTDDVTIQDNVFISTESTELGSGGNITVQARNGDVVVQDDVNVISSVRSSGNGDAGDILIDAQSITMRDNVRFQARNESRGNGGNVTLQAQGDIILDSVGLFSALEKNAVGNQAGDVNLSGHAISIINATLQSNSLGRGNAGNVRINARGMARLTGARTLVLSRLNPGGIGMGGNLEIIAPRVDVTDQAQLTTSTSGQGDAGDVIIRTGYLVVTDDARVLAATFENGNGGQIKIEAPDGIVRLENGGRLVSGALGAALGDGGDIEINTGRLILVNGGRIVTSTEGVIPSLLLASIEDLEYIELVQGDQPLVYWPLDETTARPIRDASGNGLNGTVVGVVDLTASGVRNTGAGFSGGHGSLSRPGAQTPTLNLQDQEFTVEAWVRPEANPSRDQTVLSLFSSDHDNENFSVGLNRDGSIRVSFSSPGADGRYQETHTTSRGLIDFHDSDTWHHIAVAYDSSSGGLIRVFLNGSAVTISSLGPFEGESPTLTLGDWQQTRGQHFSGTVDDVAIYRGVLSNERIIGHYLLGQQNVRTINPLLNRRGSARAGDISVNADTVSISGQNSGLFASTRGAFSGAGGNINVRANSVSVSDRGVINVQSQGQGDAGQIAIQAHQLSVSDRGIISAQSQGQGDSGQITIQANALFVSDRGSISAQSQRQGDSGQITIQSNQLAMSNRGEISARSEGRGDAGQIVINLTGDLVLNDADIATAAKQSSGGAIAITANAMRLLGDSNIRTDIATGQETGGNITLKAAESIIALDDSDILAFSRDGRGGNILLATPAFFGENFFSVSSTLDSSGLATLDSNAQVDINASGRINSGSVILPDVSLVQNTLTTLPDKLLSTDELLASSCVARHQETESFLLVSGTDGLAPAHTSASMSLYNLGTVQPLSLDTTSSEIRTSSDEGNPMMVEEPHQLYQLADGRLVVSQECS